MKIDKFVLAILVIIIMAYFFPQWGAEDSDIPMDLIASIGISVIFFFYGLKLKINEIREGLRNWRLHVLVQLATFLIFPFLVLAFYPLMQFLGELNIWLAFLFMAAIPSTVSSSVVMVSIAKGNVPAAIFNASLSGIIGIALTPLWIGPFLETQSGNFDYSEVYLKLLMEIVLPLALGLLIQKWLHHWAIHNASRLAFFDKTIILIIIYKSFAHSFSADLLTGISWEVLAGMIIAVLMLFYGMYYLLGWLCRLLGFNIEDTITAQFCGTKKSLVHGTVFSKVLFAGNPILGLIILPLMIFHALQIFIISIIAAKKASLNP